MYLGIMWFSLIFQFNFIYNYLNYNYIIPTKSIFGPIFILLYVWDKKKIIFSTKLFLSVSMKCEALTKLYIYFYLSLILNDNVKMTFTSYFNSKIKSKQEAHFLPSSTKYFFMCGRWKRKKNVARTFQKTQISLYALKNGWNIPILHVAGKWVFK